MHKLITVKFKSEKIFADSFRISTCMLVISEKIGDFLHRQMMSDKISGIVLICAQSISVDEYEELKQFNPDNQGLLFMLPRDYSYIV